MQTFKDNNWCRFPNNELKVAAFDYAKSKGVPIYVNFNREDFTFDGLVYSTNKHICGANTFSYNPLMEITISKFFEYCDNWLQVHPVTIELNRGLIATIKKDTETVYFSGYFQIKFEKINELYKLINQ